MGPQSPDQRKQLWDWNFTNHTPTADAIKKIEGMRAAGKAMKDAVIDMTPFCREQSLALTSLEQMLFYANAAIARNENTDIQAEVPEEDKALAAEKRATENPKPPLDPPASPGKSEVAIDFTLDGHRYMKTVSDTETAYSKDDKPIGPKEFETALKKSKETK